MINNRAMLVARVSTVPQRDNYSPDTQLAGMSDYARRNGFSDLLEVKDVCSGTVPIYERPGGRRLYRAIQEKSIGAVIFYTFDRASRDDYAIDFMILQRDLSQAGIELHITDRGKIGNDSFSLLMAFFGIAQAGDERKKIVERTTRGRRAKAEAGKWVGAGNVAYGLCKVGTLKECHLGIVEPEAAIVRRIFALYIGLDGKRLSSEKIAKRMTEEGAPRRGGKWHRTTINAILRNRAYIGEFDYAGQKIDLPDLSIVDTQVWEAAQAQRATNTARANRNKKYEYLLSGFLHCVCGLSMGGVAANEAQDFYYRCGYYENPHLHKCREKYIKAHQADRIAWDWFYNLVKDDAKLAEGVERMRQQSAAQYEPKRERLATLEDLIAKSERKIKQLTAEEAEAIGEGAKIRADALKDQAKLAERQFNNQVAERERLKEELAEFEFTPEKEALVRTIVRLVRDRLGDADFEQKREAFDLLHFSAQLAYKDGERGLWLSCGFTEEADFISLAEATSKSAARS